MSTFFVGGTLCVCMYSLDKKQFWNIVKPRTIIYFVVKKKKKQQKNNKENNNNKNQTKKGKILTNGSKCGLSSKRAAGMSSSGSSSSSSKLAIEGAIFSPRLNISFKKISFFSHIDCYTRSRKKYHFIFYI